MRTAELIPGANLLLLADMGHDMPEPALAGDRRRDHVARPARWPRNGSARHRLIGAQHAGACRWMTNTAMGRATNDRMAGPLADIGSSRSRASAPGPFAAMMLADMGAEVVRVERAQSVRGPAPTTPHFDVSLRGRRNIAIDLKHPDGVATLLDLVEHADALIEGFRPGVMERLGVGPDVCLARNPKLVFGRMTGWGQDGPLRRWPPATTSTTSHWPVRSRTSVAPAKPQCRRSTWSATSAAAACSWPSAWCARSSRRNAAARVRWSTPRWSTARPC